MTYALSRKCLVILSGLTNEVIEWSPCGCCIKALVLGTLGMRVLFLVLSWAYFVALDKAHHLHSSGILV